MSNNILQSKRLWLHILLAFLFLGVNSSSAASSLASRLQGYILLQVESVGEAWYVIPKEQQRVYMKDGAVAYQIMREVSLGITNANLAKIPIGIEARFNDVDTDSDGLSDKLEEGLETDPNKADTDNDGFKDGEEINNNFSPVGPNKLVYDQNLVNRLSGYILLQVEKQGQAWYVNPKDGKRYYMQDGPAAYNIMRYLSLGINNVNLNLIPKSSRVFKVDTSGANSSNQGNQGNNNNSTSTPSGNSQGSQDNNNSIPTPPANNPGDNNPGDSADGGGGGGGAGAVTNPPATPNTPADTQEPSVPSNLTASASGTQISLSWSASTDGVGVSGYQILRSSSNGGPYTLLTTSNTNSYTNTNLSVGTYYYVVRAYDAALNYSSNSNQANATIVASTDMQAPTNPTALSASASGTQITLSWLASTDNVAVARYSIERSLSASSGFQELNTSTNTSYVDTGLSSNTTYYYRLRAQDTSANYSNYTNVINTTTGAVDTQSPTTPTSLSNSVSGTQVSLSWSASTDATGVTGYNILRSTTNGSGYSLLTTSATNSYTNTNLANNTYYYVVQAYDAAGNTSSNSNQTTAVINVDSPPTTPNVLSIYANGNQISLTWTPSTDNVVSYSVERSLSPLSGFGVVATVNNTSYTNNNLNNSTTYYYRVRALDAFSAYSNYSSVVNATTDGV